MISKHASISFPVIEIHWNAKSRGAGGPAEKDLGLPAPLESILSSQNWKCFALQYHAAMQ